MLMKSHDWCILRKRFSLIVVLFYYFFLFYLRFCRTKTLLKILLITVFQHKRSIRCTKSDDEIKPLFSSEIFRIPNSVAFARHLNHSSFRDSQWIIIHWQKKIGRKFCRQTENDGSARSRILKRFISHLFLCTVAHNVWFTPNVRYPLRFLHYKYEKDYL